MDIIVIVVEYYIVFFFDRYGLCYFFVLVSDQWFVVGYLQFFCYFNIMFFEYLYLVEFY